MNYAEQVSAAVSSRLGWPLDEARNVVGDTAEYEAEGLTTDEAADAVIDAICVSA